jgi:hypothetical protein
MKTLEEVKTLEGFKEFFDQFKYEDFEIEDHSDHETFCIDFQLYDDGYLENGMIYEFDMVASNPKCSSDFIRFLFDDEEGEVEKSFDLTEEQREHVYKAIDEMTEIYKEGQEEARAYNRDIYAYHGVRRSDFY